MLLTERKMRDYLRKHIHTFPSQVAAARFLGITDQYLSDLLNERRPITASIARRLGFGRVFRFQKIL